MNICWRGDTRHLTVTMILFSVVKETLARFIFLFILASSSPPPPSPPPRRLPPPAVSFIVPASLVSMLMSPVAMIWCHWVRISRNWTFILSCSPVTEYESLLPCLYVYAVFSEILVTSHIFTFSSLSLSLFLVPHSAFSCCCNCWVQSTSFAPGEKVNRQTYSFANRMKTNHLSHRAATLNATNFSWQFHFTSLPVQSRRNLI